MMILPSTSSASNLGTLNHWYSYNSISSEHGAIARWNSTIYTKHTVVNGFTSSQFLSYVNSARNTWRNAGISISSTTSDSIANLKIIGGLRPQLQEEYWLLGDTELGITDFDDATYEGNWKYNNKDKYGLIQNSAEAYVVYEPGRTAAQYTNVTTHELGHALGWYAHSFINTDLMYTNASSVTSLSSRDKNHLIQVY